MLNLSNPELAFAMHAVRQAALLVRLVQRELVSPALTKHDRSPVTVADFASQALVGFLLSHSFPGDTLVAEEDATALRDPASATTLSQVVHFVSRIVPEANAQAVCAWINRGRGEPGARFWTLDPIDGTKGFLRGDQYAIALALIENGQVRIGVLGCPNLIDAHRPDLSGAGSLVVAAHGQGTWATPLAHEGAWLALHVSGQDEPAEARLLRSFESGHTNVDQVDAFARALGVQAAPLLMDSQAKYALLASGSGELLLRMLSAEKPRYREKIWDQAAGSLVLEEAGGRITDLHGEPLDYTTGRSLANNRGILASNGVLHAAALQALDMIGA